jgi:hypothetical protein
LLERMNGVLAGKHALCGVDARPVAIPEAPNGVDRLDAGGLAAMMLDPDRR